MWYNDKQLDIEGEKDMLKFEEGDYGIGPYEYWGSRGNDQNWTIDFAEKVVENFDNLPEHLEILFNGKKDIGWTKVLVGSRKEPSIFNLYIRGNVNEYKLRVVLEDEEAHVWNISLEGSKKLD
jgi:hypothetical protein